MQDTLKQGAGFLFSGGLAFATDAAILALLTRGFGVDPFSARMFSIACATIVAYFAHRRWTFAVQEPPSLAQFAKYLGVSATSSTINYLTYAGILLVAPATPPLVALAAATSISMIVSFVGYRFGVFRKTDV